MKVIVCLDDNYGMLFNHRRQSRDINVRRYIADMCKGKVLWMTPYSARLFGGEMDYNISEDCLLEAAAGEYCFIENKSLLPFEDYIEEITIFKWNRIYPADMKFDIPLEEHGWKCISADEFAGNSHEKISVEVYSRACTDFGFSVSGSEEENQIIT
ncbi:MAG: ribonuclease Z [Candidatus Limivicinus sp.]